MSAAHARLVFAALPGAVSATWAPSNGGAQQSGRVLIEAPEIVQDMLGVEISSAERVVSYPAEYFTGLREGETIVAGGVAYRVNSDPRALSDGTIMQARIGKFD